MAKFKFTATEIPGVQIIEPTVFGDSRGYFMETYQKDEFAVAGIADEFVQDNQSRSPAACRVVCISQTMHPPGKVGSCDQRRSV